jgi:curved DNA-binding protein
MTDHYTTLGVNKQASSDEIKKAYRKLASQHHPDKGGNKEKFQEIQAAYAVLGDEGKRAEYDNPQPQWNNNAAGFRGFEDIFQNFGGFGDIFGHRHQHFHQPQSQRNRTLNLQTAVTLEEAFTGKELVANIQLPSGREQIINVKIPPGVNDGTVLRLREIGDDTYTNITRGDVHLSVIVMPHSVFARQGDDLVKEIEVDALDAILGTNVTVNTIDGKTLNITIKEGTQPGTILSAQGYGMPNMHNNNFKGRLLLPIKVIIPINLSDTQKTLIKQART